MSENRSTFGYKENGMPFDHTSLSQQNPTAPHRSSVHSLYHSHAHLLHQHFHCTNNINECNCENCTMLKEYAAGIGLCGLQGVQTGVEEDSNEPKATYSYLKSYFVSMLQPSDNKLAMKLFGSKKGVLKEKLRQQEVGHWIIHPCSNFRYSPTKNLRLEFIYFYSCMCFIYDVCVCV